ncbi:hypothetical protein CFE70_010140 [Pyrenophora teres f. teres 0-1]
MLEYKSRNHQTYCSRKKVSSRALGHHAIYSEFYHDWDLRNKQRLGETETRGDKCWQGQLTMGNAKAHHGSGAELDSTEQILHDRDDSLVVAFGCSSSVKESLQTLWCKLHTRWF